MKLRHVALLASLALAADLSAQRTTLHPVGFTSDAPTASYLPWARPSPTQQYRQYRWMELRTLGQKVGVVRGLAMRRDNVTRAGPAGIKFWTEAEVAISTAKTTPATINRTFAANEGSDRVVVVKRKKIQYAAFPFVKNSRVQPFFYKVPFDVGKVLPFKGGTLSIDAKCYDNNLYDASTRRYRYHYFDWAYMTFGTTIRNSRRGCYGSNSNIIFPVYGYSYASLDRVNNRWLWYGYSYNGPAGGVGVQIAAARALPVSPKFPGTDCYLHLHPGTILWTLTGRANGATSTYYYPPYVNGRRQYVYLPNSKQLDGATISVQYLIADAQANRLGFTTTPMNQLTFPRTGGLDMATIYDWGNAMNNPTARYSYPVASGRGAVLQITY